MRRADKWLRCTRARRLTLAGNVLDEDLNVLGSRVWRNRSRGNHVVLVILLLVVKLCSRRSCCVVW